MARLKLVRQLGSVNVVRNATKGVATDIKTTEFSEKLNGKTFLCDAFQTYSSILYLSNNS